MANRDFKKIERIMKDFSADIGDGSSSGGKSSYVEFWNKFQAKINKIQEDCPEGCSTNYKIKFEKVYDFLKECNMDFTHEYSVYDFNLECCTGLFNASYPQRLLHINIKRENYKNTLTLTILGQSNAMSVKDFMKDMYDFTLEDAFDALREIAEESDGYISINEYWLSQNFVNAFKTSPSNVGENYIRIFSSNGDTFPEYFNYNVLKFIDLLEADYVEVGPEA